MAKRKAKSSLLSKALQNHGSDETTQPMQFIDLPPGIGANEGIAQLVEAKIGQYKTGANEGEDFVYLAGTVVAPNEVTFSPKVFADGKVQVLKAKTVEVVGQRVSQMYPVCETTKGNGEVVTLDEHIETLLNMLRLLGGDTSDLKEDDDLKDLLEGLKEAAPYTKFSTRASTPTKEYPEPRTWETLLGSEGLEDYEPEEEDDVDEPEEGEEPNDEDEEDEVEDEEEGGEAEGDEEAEEISLDDLGVAADEEEEAEGEDGDQSSRDELKALAEAAEIDPDEYSSWGALAEALGEAATDEDAEEDDEEEEEEEEPPFEPVKGGVCSYKPPKKKKPVDCEIKRVLKKAQTCDLESLADGTKFKGVAWDKLSE